MHAYSFIYELPIKYFSSSIRSVASNQVDFSLSLLRDISDNNDSIVISPFMITKILLMISSGAEESIKDRFNEILNKSSYMYIHFFFRILIIIS